MPLIENRMTWSFTSSGSQSTSAIAIGGMNRELTAYVQTKENTTATVQMLSGRTSTSPGAVIGSTSLSTGATHIMQFTGPFLSLWPYVTAMTTGTVTVEIIGN